MSRRLMMWMGAALGVVLWIAVKMVIPVASAQQAQPVSVSDANPPLIKAETRLVLVDTIVTDKKGNYISDLAQKDFKVWEDDKEQLITSFSAEAGQGSGNGDQKHYLVLFFDNSTMDMTDQARARDAAAKFIAANAGPNRLMAIADFTGTVHIAQNFTDDAERLKKVVTQVKFSSVNPNAPVEVASLGMPSLSSAEADFGARSVLLALRSMAKNLSNIPGRKSLIFLTSGFPVTPEIQSELTAVVDSCNKSNVAVYPIDVRGLTAGGPALGLGPGARLHRPRPARVSRVARASLTYTEASTKRYRGAHLVLVQHGGGGRPGGGGGAGGGSGVGGSGGGRPGGGGGGTGAGGGKPAGGGTGNPGGGGSRGGTGNPGGGGSRGGTGGGRPTSGGNPGLARTP